MRRSAAFVLSFLLPSVAVAAPELRYTTHIEARRTVPQPATSPAAVPFPSQTLVDRMVPGGSMDTTTVIGERGGRIEYSKAVNGLPAGAVVIQNSDLSTIVLVPSSKTFWRQPLPALPAVLPPGFPTGKVTFTRSGEYATVAGFRAERVTETFDLTLTPSPGIQITLGLISDVWLSDQFTTYQRAGTPQALDLARMFGITEPPPSGFALRHLLRGGILQGYEVDSFVTSITEEDDHPELFEIPPDYKEVSRPVIASPSSTSLNTQANQPNPGSPLPGTRTLIENGILSGMTIDRANAGINLGVLQLRAGGPGWVRSDSTFPNFVLTADVRLVDANSKLGIFVRSWPTFDSPGTTPNNGYRVLISESAEDSGAGHVTGFGHSVREEMFDASVLAPMRAAPGGWHRYEIICGPTLIRVTVDGKTLTMANDVENPQGLIALRAEGGVAEIRTMTVRNNAPARRTPPTGVVSLGPGVQAPRPLQQGKPNYTADAMRAKIQGSVLLSAVVMPDGSAQDISVLQSLDSGLDAQAVESVRQWKFLPGTRNGELVPVMVTIDVSFALR